MAEVDDFFDQNEEGAKRMRPNNKRKQAGPANNSNSNTLISSSTSPSPIQRPAQPQTLSSSTPTNFASFSPSNSNISIGINGSTGNRSRANTGGMVYQQPKSIQHHALPTQPLQLDSSSLYLYRSNSVSSTSTNGDKNNEFSSSYNGSTFKSQHARNESFPGNILEFPGPDLKVNYVADGSIDMNALTSLLAETTLSNVEYYGPSAAMVANTFNDEDLWGAQIGSTNSDEVVVPEEMRILPEPAIRNHLTALYYKNHFNSLPMVQREVLRVCQENIHIPHCLLLCNAVYYCGSMFSTNTALRTDMNDESTIGEEFFTRGQTLLEKKYLTTHLCTIQALLLFAIGHKSPAQRSGFISQAVTMALDMGLHTRLDDSVSPYVRAYRARIFWFCYLFDSTASAVVAKPTLINDEEISIDMFRAGDLGPEPDTFADQYVIHCLHGWQICRRIRKNTRLVMKQPPVAKSILLENLNRLDQELVEWQVNLPKPFKFLPADGCIVSEISSQSASAQLLCYGLIILLHHPYLPNPKSPEAFKDPPEGVPNSQSYCTQAAKEITKIAGILLNEAPRTFEQNTPCRYALRFALRIHLRNSKCKVDIALAKESRRDLQKTMDYIEHVENLQFFRINRGKKSDVADLLASCRAALSQDKSSMDLAKEAAAVKHQELIRERDAQRRSSQYQATQPVVENEALPQPVLASQSLPFQNQFQPQQQQQQTQPQQQQQQQQQPYGELDLAGQQQYHDNINPHLQPYKQHLQHQMLAQEQHQQQVAEANRLRRQGALDESLNQEYLQQAAMARHKHQLFLQRQQPHNNMLRQQQLQQQLRQQQQQQQQQQQHQHFQQQSLQNQIQPQAQQFHPNGQQPMIFQGHSQLFNVPNGMNDPNNSHNRSNSSNGSIIPFQILDVNDPSIFTNLSPEQQQQLFVASSQTLTGSNNMYFPQGANVPGQENSAIDLNGMGFSPKQQQLFSASASDMTGHIGGIPMSPPRLLNGMNGGIVINPSNSHQYGAMVSPPLQVQEKNNPFQFQVQGFQQNGFNGNNGNNSGSGQNNGVIINTNNARQRSPESLASPGGTISEESILKSWSIPTLYDNFFINPNLSKDDPRNDPGSFQYLPSEFEYGDAPASSPGASSVNGSTTGSGGTDGGNTPPVIHY